MPDMPPKNLPPTPLRRAGRWVAAFFAVAAFAPALPAGAFDLEFNESGGGSLELGALSGEVYSHSSTSSFDAREHSQETRFDLDFEELELDSWLVPEDVRVRRMVYTESAGLRGSGYRADEVEVDSRLRWDHGPFDTELNVSSTRYQSREGGELTSGDSWEVELVESFDLGDFEFELSLTTERDRYREDDDQVAELTRSFGVEVAYEHDLLPELELSVDFSRERSVEDSDPEEVESNTRIQFEVDLSDLAKAVSSEVELSLSFDAERWELEDEPDVDAEWSHGVRFSFEYEF